MSKTRYALLAAAAIGVTMTVWKRGLNRKRRRIELDLARENFVRSGNRTREDGKRTREDEIEELDAEQRELILRELGGQV